MASRPPQPARPRLPGNDGTWFLEAVGLPVPDREVSPDDTESDGDKGNLPWEARPPDALTGWMPDELSSKVEEGRRFRWTPIVIVGLLVVAAAAALVYLPGTSQRRADARAAEYTAALAAIRSDLPEAQQVLSVLTEPGSDPSQFAELIPTVTDLRADAQSALEIASEALPSPWPLTPRAPFDRLAPHRDTVSIEATAAEAVAGRLGNVLDYRALALGFLDLGDLPTTTDDLDDLNARLAAVEAESAALIGELPEDATLFSHKEAAQLALERFLDWHVTYVDALRTGAGDVVATHLEELATLRSGLDQQLAAALAEIRSEVDAEIIELAANLDAAIADLAG